jgi:glycosyltransferase involved in cell wall biosynthesis
MNNAGTNPLLELITVVRIFGLLQNIHPDVLLTYTPKINIYASLAARLLRFPMIANVAGLGRAFTVGGWLELLVRRLYSLALHTPRMVFFQNNDDLEEFVKARFVERQKASRLPGSGVDLDYFGLANRKSKDHEFVFLLVGRLLWDKGVGEYVAAARLLSVEHPTAKFQLLGFVDVKNPSAVSQEQVDAWDRDGVVKYLGSVDDVRNIYTGADCIVLPSYYREGVPRTLLEAASMGIPIIAADSVGCRDAIEDQKTGLLCRPRSVDDLVDKMRIMLSLSQEERRRMGFEGRNKMIREFDERIVIRKYLDVIEECMARL